MPVRAHRIQLDPTPTQRKAFAQHAGVARLVYNVALDRNKKAYQAWVDGGKAGKPPSIGELRKAFNAERKTLYPWMDAAAHRDCWAQPWEHVHSALKNWWAECAEPPRFKSKHRDAPSFYVANDLFYFKGEKVKLPKVGMVKMHETLRFSGKILSATVSAEAGRWFLAVQVEMEEVPTLPLSEPRAEVVGVDLGLSTLATLSTGEKIEGPKALKAGLKKLRRLSKRVSRRKKGSKNRLKAIRALSRHHYRVANTRNDAIHKITTRLCRENQAIVIEDLSVKRMVKNRKLSRAISDAAWGEFRRQLTYKAEAYKVRLVVADKFYPSSKKCSGCGRVKDTLALSERVYRCEGCGMVLDRDHNAAINLKNTVGATGIQACGLGVNPAAMRVVQVEAGSTTRIQ